jgi:hypothetical protein
MCVLFYEMCFGFGFQVWTLLAAPAQGMQKESQ